MEKIYVEKSNKFEISNDQKLKVNYRFSKLLLIFWVVVFLPVAIVLLITGASFTFSEYEYSCNYKGSRFFLGFWALLFFPIALLLLVLNGTFLRTKKTWY